MNTSTLLGFAEGVPDGPVEWCGDRVWCGEVETVADDVGAPVVADEVVEEQPESSPESSMASDTASARGPAAAAGSGVLVLVIMGPFLVGSDQPRSAHTAFPRLRCTRGPRGSVPAQTFTVAIGAVPLDSRPPPVEFGLMRPTPRE
jgi:hypothetical protein